MENKSNRNKILKRVFTILVILYPILSAYIVFEPMDLGVALCAIVGVMLFLTNGRNKIKIPDGYGIFLIYIVLTSVFVTHTIPFRLLLYTFVLIMGCMYCEFNKLYSYYKKAAAVCIVFFIFQELMFLLTGLKIVGIFTFLPTVYGDSVSFITHNILESKRSASFFLEPSYFAQFLFPLLALELFLKRGNNYMRNAILITAIILGIRSGNGILLTGIIWIIWFFSSDVRRSLKFRLLLFGCFVSIGLFSYMPDLISELINRTHELSIDKGVNAEWQSSGFIRFFRGYYLYKSLPTINQIFGINPIDIDYYKLINSLGLFDRDDSFLNGVQTILCLYGLIGLILFFRHLHLLGKNAPIICIVLIVGSSYLLLSESFFICGRMLLTMVLIYSLKYKNEDTVYNKHLFDR